MEASFHQRYLRLVSEIERDFPVVEWKSGDLEIWPLARMDLYLDMHRRHTGSALARSRPLTIRAAERAATPLLNLWRSRRDLEHYVWRPKPAHAVFLGDGVSLDHIDGAWVDRFCEPLIAEYEAQGLDSFLMQSGDLRRLPRRRPTYAANQVAASSWRFASAHTPDLPGHAEVLAFLERVGVVAPSLAASRLAHRAHRVLATASAFERVLRRVQPKLALVVTWYAGLGPAFLLACRRRGVLSVDLQHCPQEGAHKAYNWAALPGCGYRSLPAVFWTWTEEEAADIARWARPPWHSSLHGGHVQLAPFLDGRDSTTRAWDARLSAITPDGRSEREILVALQPIAGQRRLWEALAEAIAAAPRSWRWWIRRHPSARPEQDAEFGSLLSLSQPNVEIDSALAFPLPALLRRACAVVSLASGAAAEGAMFGAPGLFLSDEACGAFERLIARGRAKVIPVGDLETAIARLPAIPVRPERVRQPDMAQTLARLEQLASDYRRQ